VKLALNEAVRAAVAVMVVGATIGMIFTKVEVPQEWWPVAVAVIAFLYRPNSTTSA